MNDGFELPELDRDLESILDSTDKNHIFLTSDWHVYKSKYTPERNKVNITEMLKWCKANIKPNDVFIYLGDISYRYNNQEEYKEKAKNIFKSIPGIKVLILGNHDMFQGEEFYTDCGFDFIFDEYQYKDILFTHKPVDMILRGYPEGLNIHGHIHDLSTDYDVLNPYRNVNVYPTFYDNKPTTLAYILKNKNKLMTDNKANGRTDQLTESVSILNEAANSINLFLKNKAYTLEACTIDETNYRYPDINKLYKNVFKIAKKYKSPIRKIYITYYDTYNELNESCDWELEKNKLGYTIGNNVYIINQQYYEANYNTKLFGKYHDMLVHECTRAILNAKNPKCSSGFLDGICIYESGQMKLIDKLAKRYTESIKLTTYYNYARFIELLEYKYGVDYIINIIENGESNSIRESVNSKYLERKDCCYNIDKWDSKSNNILYITGASGSGKTTLAIDIAKNYKCERVELDYIVSYFFDKSRTNNEQEKIKKALKKECKDAADFFTIERDMKYHLSGWSECKEVTQDFFNWFVKAHEGDGKLYVINGLEILEAIDYKYFENRPIIIKYANPYLTGIRRTKREADPRTGKYDNFIEWVTGFKKHMSIMFNKGYRQSIKDLDTFSKNIDRLTEDYVLQEETKRSQLSDDQFGIPQERKYPLDTESHVRSAIKMFNYVDPNYEEQLANNIIKKMKQYNIKDMKISKQNRLYNYIHKSEYNIEEDMEYINESLNLLNSITDEL